MTDIIERLRSHDVMAKDAREAADEIERLCERIKELEPYEVVSGDTWKARVALETVERQAADIKSLEKERDALNTRIKHLQAKIKGYETTAPADIPASEPKSSPELEGVNG